MGRDLRTDPPLAPPPALRGLEPGIRWVEPVVPLAPAAPVHPNALGMQNMAAVVLAAMTG